MHVLFVCDGNICRSPTAAAFLRRAVTERALDVTVASAGLVATPDDDRPHQETVRAAAARGLDVTSHRSTRFSPEMVADGAVIVVMEERQRRTILEHAAHLADTVRLLSEFAPELPRDIDDPGEARPRTDEGFERCAAEIELGVAGLVAWLRPQP